MSRRDERLARQRAEREAAGRTNNPKHTERRNIPVLVPRTQRQREYMNLIEKYDLVFATGHAGTSKTFVPTSIAAEKFVRKEINKIILTRPNVSNSESLGMFKGTLEEKMKPWLRPVLNILGKYMSRDEIAGHIDHENIEFVPIETIKGNSFENAFIICDEAEDLNFDDMKKLVTRQGENSKMILAGDITQSELKQDSGLRAMIDIAKRQNLPVGVIDFNKLSDIVRGPMCRAWVEAFQKEAENVK